MDEEANVCHSLLKATSFDGRVWRTIDGTEQSKILGEKGSAGV